MNEAKLPSGQILKWREQDFPTVYTNIMGFGMTPFDIGLMFGLIGDSTPTEVTGIPLVKVILSPEQAANLFKLLSVAISTYADSNGPLRISGAVDVEELRLKVEASKVNPQVTSES